MSVKLPETLVVFATIHGVIPVTDNQAQFFTVQEGMKVTRIMATQPGACNVTTERQINSILIEMKNTFKDYTPNEIDSIIETIKPETKRVAEELKSIQKNETEKNTLFETFLRRYISKPSVKVFEAGSSLLNKFLARNQDEGQESAYDFKLNIVNIPGTPDLFDMIILGRRGPSANTRDARKVERSIYLSEIVDLLHEVGVNHLIFFDFTCSSFEGILSERDKRSVARDSKKQGMGRKTRRLKRKTKTRKGKKRTVQWKH